MKTNKSRLPPRLHGLYYDRQTIFSYRDSGKLLCMRLDLSYKCNLKCKYCYSNELIVKEKKETSYSNLIEVVEQGINLGMKSIVLLGGEPLFYPGIFDFLCFLNNKNIITVMFTNATLVTKEIAEKLYNLNVSVIAKFDGFNETQDFLCGAGYYVKRQKALRDFMCIGYHKCPEDSLRFGCASVVTNKNYHEIENVWRYLRTNNIFPHVERMTIKNKEMKLLAISNEQAKKLTDKLREIDDKEFGIQWDTPYPAIPGYNCSIFYVGCHINPYLEVSLCPELEPIESVAGKNLKDIMESDYFQKARNLDRYIKGKCSTCVYLRKAPCYGCRSKVYNRTGSIFEEDSDCSFEINN